MKTCRSCPTQKLRRIHARVEMTVFTDAAPIGVLVTGYFCPKCGCGFLLSNRDEVIMVRVSIVAD